MPKPKQYHFKGDTNKFLRKTRFLLKSPSPSIVTNTSHGLIILSNVIDEDIEIMQQEGFVLLEE